ncbi:hypothetical protein [Methylovirgula sp. 4M-Z18]|uniref:hypothetical protein n=1 Tax=Methylovirgula sp. 4M-Z18 TaxID=2293567 RepID=UPI000E2E8089|nr:hypothetical protein [Methylovirgula sp. 4M-Z18]
MPIFSLQFFETIKADVAKAFLFGTAALLITFAHNWATTASERNLQAIQEYTAETKAIFDEEVKAVNATRYLKWRYWFYLDRAAKKNAPLLQSEIEDLRLYEREARDEEAEWNKSDKLSKSLLTLMFDSGKATFSITALMDEIRDEDDLGGDRVDCTAENFGETFKEFTRRRHIDGPRGWHLAMVVCFNRWFDQIKTMRSLMDDNYAVSEQDREQFKKNSDDADHLGSAIYHREQEYDVVMQSERMKIPDNIERRLAPSWYVQFLKDVN